MLHTTSAVLPTAASRSPLGASSIQPQPHREAVPSEGRITRVCLRLLDRFELTSGNEHVAVPLATQRVVAFLALRRVPLQRRHVASNLWFETSGCDPQACLRSALWRLHHCHPDVRLLEATRTQLRLAPHVDVDVDAQVLLAERLFDPATTLDESVDQRVALEGDLLPDWDDEWVVLERERLRQIRLHALEALASRLSGDGRFGEAVETAFAVLSADPLRESAHRVLVETYLAEGNRCQAIQHYRTHRAQLWRRLHLEPAADLEALVRDLPINEA